MATAARTGNPAWQAELTWEPRSIPMTEEAPEDETGGTRKGATEEAPENTTEVTFLKVWIGFVDVFRPGRERIRFRINHRNGRSLTVTDPRDRLFGTAGTTGIWGTWPAPPVARPRPLTLTAFQSELARLAGPERAAEIIATIRSEFFLESPTTSVRD